MAYGNMGHALTAAGLAAVVGGTLINPTSVRRGVRRQPFVSVGKLSYSAGHRDGHEFLADAVAAGAPAT